VDGGLDDALGEVLLHTLGYGHNTLAVDDGLDFIDNVGNYGLLHEGRSLNDSTHVRSRSLNNVLLNVVYNILIDLTMENGLHLNHPVSADALLHDGGSYNCALKDRSSCGNTSYANNRLLLELGSGGGGLLLDEAGLGSEVLLVERLALHGGDFWKGIIKD